MGRSDLSFPPASIGDIMWIEAYAWMCRSNIYQHGSLQDYPLLLPLLIAEKKLQAWASGDTPATLYRRKLISKCYSLRIRVRNGSPTSRTEAIRPECNPLGGGGVISHTQGVYLQPETSGRAGEVRKSRTGFDYPHDTSVTANGNW